MKSRSHSLFTAAAALISGVLLFSCQSPSRYSGSTHATAESLSAPAKAGGPATRPELVANYDALADEILGTRRKEVSVVSSILKATYSDAESAKSRALASIRSGDGKAAQAAIEDTATLVAQLATEGDASVARVRKRLIEGGHHFNPLPVGSDGTTGAHHGTPEQHSQEIGGGTPAHHAEGQPPAHHADGKAPAHHADGKAPAHQAGAQPPAHHADGKVPGTPEAIKPVTPEVAGTPGAAAPVTPVPGTPATSGAAAAGTPAPGAPGTPGHHAQQDPAHHAKNPAHNAQDPAHHAQDPAHHATPGTGGNHHADADSKLGYEPGCVVITRSAKKTFLEASRALAQLSTAPSADALEKEWSKIEATWTALEGGGKD